MKFLLNELSVHNQFADSYAFSSSLKQVLGIRRILKKAGSPLHCTNKLLTRPVYENVQIYSVLRQANFRQLHSQVRIWLFKDGPFWDAPPAHDFAEDYFTLADDDEVMVTEFALAEAAFFVAGDQSYSTISFSPSKFCVPSLSIRWYRGGDAPVFDIPNSWTIESVLVLLEQSQVVVTSWDEMLGIAAQRFQNLLFVGNLREYLDGVPFRRAAADRFFELFAVLDELVECVDGDGKFTQRGREINQNYFQGKSARFSDESVTNKRRFKSEMTFMLPDGRSIFCPYHGKVYTGVMRMHFTWPITVEYPLYIVYIGPKITKK